MSFLSAGAGDGTLSELASALCLGRPVLVIADPERSAAPWPAVHSWFEAGKVSGAAVADVLKRTSGKLGGPEGVLGDLARTVTKANLHVTERCELQALDADDAISAWVSRRLQENTLGAFPDVRPASDAELSELKSMELQYRRWLEAE